MGGMGCGNVPIKDNANRLLFQKAEYIYISFRFHQEPIKWIMEPPSPLNVLSQPFPE